MTRADRKADALVLSVEHHIEALHDDGTHYRTSTGLRHSEFIAVLLSRGHVLHRPQILLQRDETQTASHTCIHNPLQTRRLMIIKGLVYKVHAQI